MIEYLGEIETEFKTLKPVYQGPVWVGIMKKYTVGRTLCVTHSL